MPKFTSSRNNFTAGELSPILRGRADIPQHANGCEKLENMLPHPLGGVERRPPTFSITELVAADTYTRVIPFENSFGDYLICLQDKDVVVLEVIPSTGSFTAKTINGSAISIPYTNSADAAKIRYVQSVDVMWLVHPDYPPIKISAVDTNSTFYDVDIQYINWATDYTTVPYRATNATSASITIDNVSGASADLYTAISNPAQIHKNSILILKSATKLGVYKVGNIDGGAPGGFTGNHATLIFGSGFTSGESTTDWTESAWSDYRGWPSTIEFFRERLAYGGNNASPDTVWFSKNASYDVMSRNIVSGVGFETPTIAYAFDMILTERNLGRIRWMATKKALTVGTTFREFIIDKIDANEVFGVTATVINAESITDTNYTSGDCDAIIADDEVIFASPNSMQNGLKSFKFSFQSDSYTADNLSIIADHLPRKKTISTETMTDTVIRIAYDPGKKCMWVLSSSGQLYSVTYDRKLGVVAWARQFIGPYSAYGSVQDICMCGDRLYMVATVGSYQAIQIMGKYNTWDSVFAGGSYNYTDSPVHTDFSLIVPLSSTDTIPAAVWDGYFPVNTEISVVVDGKLHRNISTPATAIEDIVLDYVGVECVLGYSYKSKILTMPFEPPFAEGSSMGATKRIDKATIKFGKTVGCKFGPSEFGLLEDVQFRDASVNMDDPTPLFTGDKELHFDGDYTTEAQVYIEQPYPMPMTVLSVTARGSVSNG